MVPRRPPLLGLAILVAAVLPVAACGAASADALVREGRALLAKGRPSEAAAKLEAALDDDPDCLPAEGCLAAAYHGLCDLERAVDHYWAVQRRSYPPLAPTAPEPAVRERELLVECEALVAVCANEERRKQGLPLLVPDAPLAEIARQHSQEMRDLSYFSHQSPTRGLATIRERLQSRLASVADFTIAENIARRWSQIRYSLAPAGIRSTHEEWMDSPGHRANILNKRLASIGVGIAVNSRGDYWATEFFATYSMGAH